MSQFFAYVQEHLIAIGAMIISLFILYTEHLKSFSLTVKDVGRVIFAINPYSPDRTQHCVMLDISFRNDGARTGIVEDIAISVKKGNDKPALLRAKFLIVSRTLNLTNTPLIPEMETFISFDLLGKESYLKRIMFVPYEVDSDFLLSPETYGIDLHVRTSKSAGWKKYSSVEFSVSKEDIASIERTNFKPEAGGGYFVTWYQQDKTTDKAENALKSLLKKVSP